MEIIFEIEEEQKSTCVIKKEETAVLADQTSPKQVDDTKPVCADALMKKKLELKQRLVCKVCLKEDVSVMICPCGHLGSCLDCVSEYKSCHSCDFQQSSTDNTRQVFKSF